MAMSEVPSSARQSHSILLNAAACIDVVTASVHTLCLAGRVVELVFAPVIIKEEHVYNRPIASTKHLFVVAIKASIEVDSARRAGAVVPIYLEFPVLFLSFFVTSCEEIDEASH